MRFDFPWMGLVVVFALAPCALAQERRTAQEPPAGMRRAAAARGGTDQDAREAGRLVTVEVIIAEVLDGSTADMTAETLAQLDGAEKVRSQSRFRLAALENRPASVQFGERVSIVTGRVAFPGRGGEGGRVFAQEAVSQENVGTQVNVTARVEADDSIVIELSAEQTKLTPVPAKAAGDDADARTAHRSGTESIQCRSTVRVAPGKTVVAGSKTTKSDQGPLQTWILLSASAEAGRAKEIDDASVLKVFAIAHAKAESLAELIQSIFRGENIRIGVDFRTNSLVVKGDAQKLEIIERVIARLDEEVADGTTPAK